MKDSLTFISLTNLLIIFIPLSVILIILYFWELNWRDTIYALVRMTFQLIFIGFFLNYLFNSSSPLIIVVSLLIMISIASWISLRTVPDNRILFYKEAFFSILIGGGFTLFIVTQYILNLNPWYLPKYIIPIAGMIFASSMNGISLAYERVHSELFRDKKYDDARKKSLEAALIPSTNSLFAVGIVSLPGMMTGQIISGVSPLIAARYQILVMCMLYAAAGITTSLFLSIIKVKITKRVFS
jgi:putative ABC transport system permease protein